VATPLAYIEGKYEILEKLSDGGMGAIYKVRHRLLDEIRVIKVMQPQHEQDEGLRARFLREARMAVKLRHPGIAQMYDFAVDESGNAFIVMEFIDGITFQEMLERVGPPSIGLALELSRQSLEALGYLHRKGIVHRDIAPDNIMIGRDDTGRARAKLIDLGIAKVLKGDSGLTVTGMFVGKLRYSSPEQFRTEPGVSLDERSDIYSFGVVLYEVLTGRHPISGTSPQALIAGHLLHPPADFGVTDPGGRIPEELRRIVLKAMNKAQEERFPSGDAFARALAQLQGGYPIPESEFDRILDLPVMPTQRIMIPKQGSTQDRFDAQFKMVPTPAPAVLGASQPGGTPAAPPPQGDQRLDEGDREAARAAAVAEARHEVAAGRLEQAARRLTEAGTRYGEDESLARFRSEVEEARRNQRDARVALLLTEARSLIAAGRHEDALARLRQARADAPGNAEVDHMLAEVEAAINASGPPTKPTVLGPPPMVTPPPSPTVAGKSEPPPARAPAAIPRPPSRPVSLGVAGAVVIAIAVIAVGWLLLRSRSIRSAGVVRPRPTAIPSARPTTAPVPTAIGQASAFLTAAEAAFATGDLDTARANLDALASAGPEGLSQDERARLSTLREKVEAGQRRAFVATLERGLGSGDLDRLERLLASSSEADVRVAATTGKVGAEVKTARQAVDAYRAMTLAEKTGNSLEVVRSAGAVLALVPHARRVATARQSAAEALESEADALAKNGKQGEALKELEAIREAWPDREGLAARIVAAQSAHAEDQQLAAALAEARKAGEQGHPDRGVEVLKALTPTTKWQSEFAQEHDRLEAQLAQLDKQFPSIRFKPEFKFEYDKGKVATVPLVVMDDYHVQSVEAFARVAGSGAYTQLPVQALGGPSYVVEVAPSFHHNDTVEFYIVAKDVSGHATQLGTKDEPLKLKRKHWLF
jgi:serine/threonine protein kinase